MFEGLAFGYQSTWSLGASWKESLGVLFSVLVTHNSTSTGRNPRGGLGSCLLWFYQPQRRTIFRMCVYHWSSNIMLLSQHRPYSASVTVAVFSWLPKHQCLVPCSPWMPLFSQTVDCRFYTVFLFLFFNRISNASGWPQIGDLAEGDFWPSHPPASTSRLLGL